MKYSGETNPYFCKTRCGDPLHDFMGKPICNWNRIGDYLISIESLIFLLILFSGRMSIDITMQLILIMIFLNCTRGVLCAVTTCTIDSNISNSTIYSDDGNNLWYFISGHTMNATLIAVAIMYSTVPYSVKVLSVILTLLICFFQAATREHHTVDIIFTIILVYLSCLVFLRIKDIN
jgi:hypothetical protein